MSRLVGFAVAISLVVVAAASATPPLPRMLGCAGKPLLRPAGLVVLSCADANSELKATHWRSWGHSVAAGITTFGLNPCTPSCAASRIQYFPQAHVRLSDPKATTHGSLFRRATITYIRHGRRKTFVAYLPTRPL